jgi:hypothetical protein
MVFISLSKTIAKFGGIRLGVGMRMSKKNAPAFIVGLLTYYTFLFIWYMILFTFWMMYAMIYGTVWVLKNMFKISIPFIDKLFKKISDECNKKEGNQA